MAPAFCPLGGNCPMRTTQCPASLLPECLSGAPSLLEVSQPSCSLWLCGHPCYGSKTTYGGRVCRTHGLRVHSITVGKPRQQGCAAKSGRERWVLVLSVLPPFSQSRTPVHAVVPPTFRVDLPASAQCRNPLAYLEVCLLGDFGHCRVDSINRHTVEGQPQESGSSGSFDLFGILTARMCSHVNFLL